MYSFFHLSAHVRSDDLLQIHVGNQTFGIHKNDVPLTDLFAKFNLIISSTAEHMTLNHDAKLAIMQLQQIINDWEIIELKDAIEPCSVVPD